MALTAQCRIVRFSLTAADAPGLARFYERAFGCSCLLSGSLPDGHARALSRIAGNARTIELQLGQEAIELVQFDAPGAAYPRNALASDLLFQHFAIVVADMACAWAHLHTVRGWTAITRGGPRHLPPSSGGVTAFKFRDPEGHPLELLEFPPDRMPPKWAAGSANHLFLGIDHTAISVADTHESVAFYESLGFRTTAQSHNSGEAQAALDDLQNPEVDVTALAGPEEPHVELLCYRHRKRATARTVRWNDIAATRLVLRVEPDIVAWPRMQLAFDPDGHRLLLQR